VTRIAGFLKQNAIALAALFVALGGTSYAAIAIPKNSIGSRQLRKGAVTATKIHSGAITPGKLSSKSFGGRILYLAKINPNGSVAFSHPRGISTTMWTEGTSGILVLPHPAPRGCVPLAGAASVTAAPPSTGVASGVPAASAQFDSRTDVQLIFNGGFPVTVEILCGS
jgi:hypothetical protein